MRLILLVSLLCLQYSSNSWGFKSHKSINFQAVFLLPDPLYSFYRDNINQIEEWAVKADQRRYIVESEGPKHFIDIDIYESSLPLDTIAISFDSACRLFTKDSIMKHGCLAWNIMWVYYSLIKAMKQNEIQRIIALSADLGHYIADAHVPLHTTSNYNGQLTGQDGIHALWESRLPDLYTNKYIFINDKAHFIENPDSIIWLCIAKSHSLLDDVLQLERILSEEFGINKYSFENYNNRLRKVYSPEFCEAYHSALNGMVETRMLNAMHLVSSFWYTAWVRADRPTLNEKGAFIATDSLPAINAPLKTGSRTLLH